MVSSFDQPLINRLSAVSVTALHPQATKSCEAHCQAQWSFNMNGKQSTDHNMVYLHRNWQPQDKKMIDRGVTVRYKIIRTSKGQNWSDKHVGARFMWGNGTGRG
jgi:hypothetical protein